MAGYKLQAAIRLSKTYPRLGKFVVWLWSRIRLWFYHDYQLERHTQVMRLAESLGYRIPVVTRLRNGMKIRVACNDWVGKNIYEYGYYEEDTIKLIESLLGPDKIFLDIGAHVGQYTLIASQLVGPSGQVHSFEPDPNTFRWLAANVQGNRLKNVRLNQVALSSEVGLKRLYLATVQDIGSNSLARPINDSGKSYQVHSTTLDDYLMRNQISRVDVIKIDVEGAEHSVFLGASKLLTMKDKPAILVEFEEERQKAFGVSCAQLASLLESYGYTLYRVGNLPLDEYVPQADEPYSFNILALPESMKLSTDLVAKLTGSAVLPRVAKSSF